MPHEAYRVASGLPGSLWIMPHPPADALSSALSDCSALGVDCVLSLLESNEATALGLAAEQSCCERLGMKYLSFPIPDFSTPGDGFSDQVSQLSGLVQGGAGLAIHCRAGIGRSGMVAACVLVSLDIAAPRALEAVSNARGVAVPETIAQRDVVLNFLAGAQ